MEDKVGPVVDFVYLKKIVLLKISYLPVSILILDIVTIGVQGENSVMFVYVQNIRLERQLTTMSLLL